MNNEDTLYLNNEENPIQDEITSPIPPKAKKSGMSGKAKVATAGAAGVLLGTVVGATSTGAVAAGHSDNTNEEVHNIPEHQDALIVNEEGIRFAHVDADNFEDAFAQAREQVGPGGAFEYNGKIYATYYAEEWQEMSQSERVDFQAKALDVVPEKAAPVTHVTNNYYTTEVHNHPEQIAEAHTTERTATPVQQELPVEPVPDDEVRILGVETVRTPEGYEMDVVGVAVGDDPALLVDVNQDGYLDVLIHDDNQNGHIEDNEIYDISGANMHMADLGIQMPHDDIYMASDEASIDNIDDPDIMPV